MTDDDVFMVDVDGGNGAAVVARLARFKLRVKAEIEALPWHCVALRGPGAADTLAAVDATALPPGTDLVAPFVWDGVTGVDLLGPAPETPAGLRACGPAAWQSVRVEAGIPMMGAELDERTIAAEAGLLERCVSFTKGCYTGQELVARLDARGNKVARRLRGIVVERGPGDAGHAGGRDGGRRTRGGPGHVGGMVTVSRHGRGARLSPPRRRGARSGRCPHR